MKFCVFFSQDILLYNVLKSNPWIKVICNVPIMKYSFVMFLFITCISIWKDGWLFCNYMLLGSRLINPSRKSSYFPRIINSRRWKMKMKRSVIKVSIHCLILFKLVTMRLFGARDQYIRIWVLSEQCFVSYNYFYASLFLKRVIFHPLTVLKSNGYILVPNDARKMGPPE